MWVTSSLTTVLTPTAIALGNFDGVHRGHRQVVKPILDGCFAPSPGVTLSQSRESKEQWGSSLSLPQPSLNWLKEAQPQADSAAQTWESSQSQQRESNLREGKQKNPVATVVTFHPHPQEFFTGQPKALLTPPDEKVAQLREMGVEQLVLLPFDRELADLSPQQFVEEILVKHLQAVRVSVGEDFRFGHSRVGTAADLGAIAAGYGIAVTVVPLHTCQGERISSSHIRSSLERTELARANRLLGRPYSLTGTVVTGQQLGRTLGFPTANLQLPREKFLPGRGVYAVRAWSEAIAPPELPVAGVMNVGYRPTVGGASPTVEVHLLDWSGDLYGQTLTVSLEEFLRPEQKFPSLEALKAQIQADCTAARKLLNAKAYGE